MIGVWYTICTKDENGKDFEFSLHLDDVIRFEQEYKQKGLLIIVNRKYTHVIDTSKFSGYKIKLGEHIICEN